MTESEVDDEAASDADAEVEVSGEQASGPQILGSVLDSAEHEMERGAVGLLLSGFSAGLDIGFGPLLMAVLLTVSEGGFGDLGTELLVAAAYSIGFVFVIVARSELFTEHTMLAMMPVLDGEEPLRRLGRLWGLIWASNVAGGAVFALFVVTLMPNLGVAEPTAFVTIAEKLVEHDPTWLFVAGILAGWLMGLLAWLITAAKETTSRLLIIVLVTASIGLLHLPHSIAGNVEVLFGVLLSSEITVLDYAAFLGLATVGNVVGGSVFVALLKYGHVVRGAG